MAIMLNLYGIVQFVLSIGEPLQRAFFLWTQQQRQGETFLQQRVLAVGEFSPSGNCRRGCIQGKNQESPFWQALCYRWRDGEKVQSIQTWHGTNEGIS